MVRVYISIGSNHNREHNIAQAVSRLREIFGSIECSPVYHSAAVDGRGEDYQNMAAGFDTQVSPAELYAIMQGIEAELGRDRHQAEKVSIDLDILLYGDVIAPRLPHPDLFRYRHVLKPLADIAGDLVPPGSSVTISAMLRDVSPAKDEPKVIREC